MGFGKQRVHIEIAGVTSVDLIECDLELSTDIFIVQSEIILFAQKHILILRLVIFNWDWPDRPAAQRLTHFAGELKGSHRGTNHPKDSKERTRTTVLYHGWCSL
jgi:hypothetical protein